MKKLLILSGKGGTGKTTAAAAFISFSRAKAFADCDVDAPNLHLVAGVEGESRRKDFIGSQKAEIEPKKCVSCGLCMQNCRFNAVFVKDGVYKVNEYACEGCGVCEYVCPAEAVSMAEDTAGVQLLYASQRVFSTARLKMGRGNSGKLVTAVKNDMIKNAPETELAIIDGSPGIGCPVIASVSGVDMVLIVAEPSISGINDLERLVKTGESFRTKLAVCVNKWDLFPENCRNIERFCHENDIPFLGGIPYDKAVPEAVNAGRSVAGMDCPASHALREIYEKAIEILYKGDK